MPPGGSEGGLAWWIILVIVLAVVAVLAVAGFLAYRFLYLGRKGSLDVNGGYMEMQDNPRNSNKVWSGSGGNYNRY